VEVLVRLRSPLALSLRRCLPWLPCLFLLLAPPARAAPSPELRGLVRKCVAAYGGQKALGLLAHLAEEGTVTSVLHPGATGRIARTYVRPSGLRVEIQYPDKPAEVRVLDGARGWRSGDEVTGPLLLSMVLQAARLDLPALLAAGEAKVQDRGSWQHEGRSLRVLALPIQPGVEVEAGIDPATGRILRSRGTATGEMPLEFVTTYADFRRVEGALVPFREGNWANGQATGGTTLQRVSLPRRYPEKLFKP
jgi:hypothetical protein